MDPFKTEILKQFGEQIRKLRIRAEMSQDDIVNNSKNITQGTVSDIENGKRNLSLTTLVELAKGLGIPVKDLFDFHFNLKDFDEKIKNQ